MLIYKLSTNKQINNQSCPVRQSATRESYKSSVELTKFSRQYKKKKLHTTSTQKENYKTVQKKQGLESSLETNQQNLNQETHLQILFLTIMKEGKFLKFLLFKTPQKECPNN